jgi:SagB-type dehydrogenase family enzyme
MDLSIASGTKRQNMNRFTSGQEILASRSAADSLFELYHENSKLSPMVERLKLAKPSSSVELAAVLTPERAYCAPSQLLKFELDAANAFVVDGRDVPLAQTLARRRSAQNFTDEPVTRETVEKLLVGAYHASGVLQRKAGQIDLRTAPSAGALFPVQVSLLAVRIVGLRSGVYRYHVADPSLEIVGQDPATGSRLSNACPKSPQAQTAAGAVVLTARFGRTAAKYDERGYRYALIEIGHIAQNLCLAAAALELGMLCHGGFYDDLLNRLLLIDIAEESAVYILLFGHERR